MSKNDSLTLARPLHHLLEQNVVHHYLLFDALLLRDADVLLLQGDRTVRVIKVENTLFDICSDEESDVLVVGQSGGETYYSGELLDLLLVSERTSHDAFQYWASAVS